MIQIAKKMLSRLADKDDSDNDYNAGWNDALDRKTDIIDRELKSAIKEIEKALNVLRRDDE